MVRGATQTGFRFHRRTRERLAFIRRQQPLAQQLLGQRVDIGPIALFTDANGDHVDGDLLSFHGVKDTITLTNSTQAAVAGKFARQGVSLFLRLMLQ